MWGFACFHLFFDVRDNQFKESDRTISTLYPVFKQRTLGYLVVVQKTFQLIAKMKLDRSILRHCIVIAQTNVVIDITVYPRYLLD